MGVQAEVPSRERRARAGSPQDEVGAASVKRFKSSPMSSEEENGSSGLKMRLSRYPGLKPESAVKSCEVRVSPLASSVKVESPASQASPVYDISTSMSSSEIISCCERVGPGEAAISTSVLADQAFVPRPKRRHELPKLSPEQLLPATPSVHVKTKAEAFSPQLLEWCLQRPITVIRGMAQACDIDLGLYTTKTLAQTNPNHPVEIRSQLEQNSDENWDPTLSEEVSPVHSNTQPSIGCSNH